MIKTVASRGKKISERLGSARLINRNFPRFSPCETGERSARESLIYQKIVQIQVALIFLFF